MASGFLAPGACALRVKHIFTSLAFPVCLRMRQVHAVLDQRVVGALRLHALPHGGQHSVKTAVERGEMRPRQHREGGIVGRGLSHH